MTASWGAYTGRFCRIRFFGDFWVGDHAPLPTGGGEGDMGSGHNLELQRTEPWALSPAFCPRGAASVWSRGCTSRPRCLGLRRRRLVPWSLLPASEGSRSGQAPGHPCLSRTHLPRASADRACAGAQDTGDSEATLSSGCPGGQPLKARGTNTSTRSARQSVGLSDKKLARRVPAGVTFHPSLRQRVGPCPGSSHPGAPTAAPVLRPALSCGHFPRGPAQ